MVGAEMKKGSASFLKKRSKKLLNAGTWAVAMTTPLSRRNQSFFGSFCSQKELLSFSFLDFPK
jgi:hypothetical protein